MVITVSWRKIIKNSKICLKIMLLTLIIFYILPTLIFLLWEGNNPGLKMRDQQLLEKPLRVMTTSHLNGRYSIT